MMPCDRDFGCIEQRLRKRQCIYTPDDYVDIVANARVQKPFTVVKMTSSDFVSLNTLTCSLTKRNLTDSGHKWDFRSVCQFRFKSDMGMRMEVSLTMMTTNGKQ